MAKYSAEEVEEYVGELREEIATLSADLRTFAEESTETAHLVRKTAEEVEAIKGRQERLTEAMYASTRKDFTTAERLQYAIDLGASEDDVRLFFESFVIAVGGYTYGAKGEKAEDMLSEIRDLINVYQAFRKRKIDEIMSEGDGEI